MDNRFMAGGRCIKTFLQRIGWNTGGTPCSTWRRGNVSLLVIFVLLASSLIALLAMHQIQHLMSYGAMTNAYFRAYYLAKAGLELALTEVALREAGFEMQVLSGDAVVTGNLLPGYEGFQPFFTVGMQARTTEWSGSLAAGESIVIPLFLDSKELGHSKWLTGVKESDLEKYTIVESISLENEKAAELLLGLFAFSGEHLDEMVGMVTQTGTNLVHFWNNEEVSNILRQSAVRAYLTIVNASSTELPLRITSSSPFAIAATKVDVQAHYGETEVGLQAIFRESFPPFLQGLSEYPVTDGL